MRYLMTLFDEPSWTSTPTFWTLIATIPGYLLIGLTIAVCHQKYGDKEPKLSGLPKLVFILVITAGWLLIVAAVLLYVILSALMGRSRS